MTSGRAYNRTPVVDGGVARVPLTQGLVALIDAADVPLVERQSWYACWAPTTQSFYAVTRTRNAGRLSRLSMARLILGVGAHHVDHRNHDTLDNRRSNLRAATHSENMRNRRGWGRSGFLGAYPTRSGRWHCMVRIDGQAHRLGTFDTAEEAGRVRDHYIRTNFPSQFWTYNFPLPGEQGTHSPATEATA